MRALQLSTYSCPEVPRHERGDSYAELPVMVLLSTAIVGLRAGTGPPPDPAEQASPFQSLQVGIWGPVVGAGSPDPAHDPCL